MGIKGFEWRQNQPERGRISAARVKAALAVNAELVTLYWSIGREIIVRQEREGWGAKVLERLSEDLRRAFPDMKGLSARNLTAMRDLAREWPDEGTLPQLVARIPWGHNPLARPRRIPGRLTPCAWMQG